MKTVIAVLAALLLGAVLGYYYHSSRTAVSVAQAGANESNWAAEKAALEQQLAEARRRSPDVRTITRTHAVTNKLSAPEILQRLTQLNPETSDDSRNRTLRQIVHHLQMLADLGSEALPTIRDFLKANKDLDYSYDVLNAAGERVSRTGAAAWTSRAAAPTDFLVPPSLRLGLIDVLDQIGGDEAQAILAETLDITGRGVEVAHIARVLHSEAPDKYRDAALKAAKDLLSNPVAAGAPNRIDENARAYLYQVLTMHNDTSFAPVAQSQLINPDGHVDKQALNYLSGTFKEQSVPALFEACKNPKLTNQSERATLVNAVLAFAGPSAQANQLFSETIVSEEIPSGIRAFTVQGLAGGSGRERPTDPAVIQSRIQLLQTLRGQTKDERILRSIDDTRTALERLAAAPKE